MRTNEARNVECFQIYWKRTSFLLLFQSCPNDGLSHIFIRLIRSAKNQKHVNTWSSSVNSSYFSSFWLVFTPFEKWKRWEVKNAFIFPFVRWSTVVWSFTDGSSSFRDSRRRESFLFVIFLCGVTWDCIQLDDEPYGVLDARPLLPSDWWQVQCHSGHI